MERGERVLLVEDVATTGGQVLEACKTFQDAGGTTSDLGVQIPR